MCSRNVEVSVEAEEEIAQITCALTRADDSWPWTIRIKLIIEEKLYFGVDFFE